MDRKGSLWIPIYRKKKYEIAKVVKTIKYWILYYEALENRMGTY